MLKQSDQGHRKEEVTMYTEEDIDKAIDIIYDFGSKLKATTESVKTVALTCVANMEDDIVAKGASKNLNDIMNRIVEINDTELRPLMSKLEEEKSRAQKIAQDED